MLENNKKETYKYENIQLVKIEKNNRFVII